MLNYCNVLTIPTTNCDNQNVDMSDSSSSRILAPSPMSSFVVTPSTSFAAASSYHDIYTSLAMSSTQTSTPTSYQLHTNAPPPPYHSAHQLLLLHNMAAQLSSQQPVEDVDIDVVGLTDTTKDVSLNDRDDTSSEEGDRPLDLSCKTTTQQRPSVIIDTTSCAKSTKHVSVRRSMSSVSSSGGSSAQDDVTAHFKRSLSGKWPKRNPGDARNSPIVRRRTFNTSTTPAPQTIINHHCSDTSTSVADHFRRALSGKLSFK